MCLAWYLLVLTRVFSLQWEAIKDSDLTKRRIESIRHVLGHEKSGFSQKFSFKYLLSERAARSVFLFWKKKTCLKVIYLALTFVSSYRAARTAFVHQRNMAESRSTNFLTSVRCFMAICGLLLSPVLSKPSYDASSINCGTTKTDSSGQIHSPNYPLQYPTEKECSWTIKMSEFQKIVLVFEIFNLEPTQSNRTGCDNSGDYVEVYENSLELIGRYCAGAENIPPRQITSEGHILRVVFKSDNRSISGFGGGFRAIYSSCGGYFTESSASLSSPNYPVRFPVDVTCQWQIRVPTDYVIELRFNDFNMDGKYPCNVDYVKVMDGLNSNNTEIGHFCSTRLPGKYAIRSTGNTMSVEFKSYKESNSRGFFAHYKRVPHCTGFLKSDYGRFTSPGYPGPRKIDRNCNWLITVSEGKIVSLMFDFFEVDSMTSTFSTSGDCSQDYVDVFDGTGDNDKSLGRFCTVNNKPVGMVRSSGRQMLVRLKTSFQNQGKGFLASYYGVDPENSFEGCEVFHNQLLFTCKNGKKIQCQLKCDGTNDCPDASDERHCKTLAVPATKTNNDIRNYIIVILSVTGTALAVVCIGFIIDRMRTKRTARPRRRRQRRRRARISTADDAPLTDEPSSPPPPYEFAADGRACNIFDVAFIQPCHGGSHPPRGAGARGALTNESQSSRSSPLENQGSAVTGHENSPPTASGREEEDREAPIVNATGGTVSPAESVSSFNDTVPLIRSYDSVIEL